MIFKRTIGALGVACLLLPLASSCAPEKAKSVRQARNLTLGLLGVSYRPTGDFSVGMNGAVGNKTKVELKKKRDDSSESFVPDGDLTFDRDTKKSYQTINAFAHYFPWDSSAFFVGAGLEYDQSKYYFNEQIDGSTALNPLLTDIEYGNKAVYATMPFGWEWIWESGFALTLNLDLRHSVSDQTSYAKDGSQQKVAVDSRDAVVQELDRNHWFGAGLGIIGYAF